jgi:hypothetical protein
MTILSLKNIRDPGMRFFLDPGSRLPQPEWNELCLKVFNMSVTTSWRFKIDRMLLHTLVAAFGRCAVNFLG